ncbi:sigma-70 family RNA polymerase sigma factor [Calidifontibacter sp. DB0510]|uniref:Sigma-70 family RNA polymerase sigma factor n=1 Tax=Metallococcus carri TaxID=1656884 RepID=A0A967EBJ3_9MICO|nr:sigma-70 family RNA polymerase sigma factor [Metallococcus carri]NHN57375.1 sigma-70 family RNA polymerase sigma factor [Metallococcus carri]NOP39153.1 sigma-70 family RNA polymerase sigma factor [Calidifontibacter sp. DB2511S]
MDRTDEFEAERSRLTRIAAGILGDPVEAQDIVQQAWLRWDRAEGIDQPAAWLTTVTTRLCLDRLRQRVPEPVDEDVDHAPGDAVVADPAEDVALADTVGVALAVVLERLSPNERVAFVLHDTFGFGFPTIAEVLSTSPVAARKLASRARAKLGSAPDDDLPADWEVVDAFLDAARGGDLQRLLTLLAPDVVVAGDPAAVATGTPERLEGRDAVSAMFNGAAKSALPVFVEERPGAAWFLHGEAKVAFDFTVVNGVVTRIDFRAEPALLSTLVRRAGATPRS